MLESRVLDAPLEMPFRIAYDTVTHARNVLVTVRDGDLIGFGEAAPQATITGEDQTKVLDDLHGGRPRGIAGRTALDCARLDLAARTAGKPLCEFLGARRVRPVPTSITIPLVPDDQLDALVRRRLDQGFWIFKLKTGLGIDQDLRRVRRVRRLIGDAELRVDANQGWSLQAAAKALAALADSQVSVIEQPLPKADLQGHARLRQASREVGGPPIMLDESVFTPSDAEQAVAMGACDWINIKLQKSGGLGPALQIADIAAAVGVPCMVGCMIETRIGMAHAAHLVLAHDNIKKADIDGAWLLGSDPVVGGGHYEDGAYACADAPGIGVSAVQS